MCGEHVVNADGLPTCAGMVKGASVHLLFLITAANDLETLTGDIGNAFVSAKTPEKHVAGQAPNLARERAR